MKNENQRNEELKIFDRYFEALPKWDKIDHIGNLAEYLKPKKLSEGVDEMPRLKVIFKKMIVKMVACSMGKTLNKHCFVLIGEKGIGKTLFLNWLCPPGLPYIITSCIETSNDGLIKLTENFLIQIVGLNKENNNLKIVLSTEQVRLRAPYSTKPELLNRRCNIVATSNSLDFMNDESMLKRCVCFNLIGIDSNYRTNIDIQKLWSQAYHLFQSDQFDYKLNQKDVVLNELANSAYLNESIQ